MDLHARSALVGGALVAAASLLVAGKTNHTNCLLTIQQAEILRLPARSTLERWFTGNHDAVRVDIDVAGLGSCTVWAVHLEVRDEATRVRAARAILDEVGPHAFVVGDFNSSPSENVSSSVSHCRGSVPVMSTSSAFEMPSPSWSNGPSCSPFGLLER